MPVEGFLTPYEQTVTVDLGRGYWAEVKEFLTSVENGRAQNALGRPSMKAVNGEPTVEMSDLDQPAFMREVVANALVNWNLTDKNNAPLPQGNVVLNRQSVGLLPDWVVKELASAVKQGKRDDADSKSVPAEDAVDVEGTAIAVAGSGSSDVASPVLEDLRLPLSGGSSPDVV